MTESSSARDRLLLPGLGLACLSFLLIGIAIGVGVGGVMPLPYGPAAAVTAYVRGEPDAVRIIAVAVFASSVPLAIYAAVASARLRRLGVSAPVAATTLAGGVLAAGALGLTALVGWTLSQPDVAVDAALVRALYFLVFLVGGPGHLTALGLLVACIAAPGRDFLPGPLVWAGLAIAALAELTTLVLVWPQQLGVVLPIARVSALSWLVLTGALVPLRRNDVRDTRRQIST